MTTRQSFSYACSTCPPQLDAGVHGSAGVPSAGTPRVLPRGDTRQPHPSGEPRVVLPAEAVEGPEAGRGHLVRSLSGTDDGRLPRGRGHYDPGFLDDQRLRQGKHHTVLRLEGYQVSVIPFVRPRRLKEELNDQFRSAHLVRLRAAHGSPGWP
ncbi:unnamed protein product [Prorocentrum cordatum]|uniref:Uncharacterized protein n=1 Tax=Prorocentrum cordatum TaxID=2364126 RepID=A0ABN9T9S9_9DINO|nr:unnamed protein product [Polarella glacialis]